jgi:hypothetical protein
VTRRGFGSSCPCSPCCRFSSCRRDRRRVDRCKGRRSPGGPESAGYR